MKFELTPESPESPAFKIDKVCQILLTGDTPCMLYRSVEDSGFYPMTDSKGEEMYWAGDNPSDVIFNSSITNSARACEFKIVMEPSASHVNSKVNGHISQGW